MPLEPFKFVVQAVLLEKDSDGRITGECSTDPVTIYGVENLKEWIDHFPDALAALAGSQEQQVPGTADGPRRAARR
jgi:hypothetical protein